MALRASATVRSLTLPPSPPPRKSFSCSKLAPKSLSHSAKTTLPLFVLFTVPHEANALAISKEQIVSSLEQVESTINQVQEVGSNIFDVARQVIGVVLEAVKPGVDVALPILKQAGEQAVKIASPVVSEFSKKAQETMQSSGIDTQPVISAAKTVADVAQQTTKVIDEAKPIATSTVETISSSDPVKIVGAGGVLFLAYLLLPPIFSAISLSFRGYKGDLTPAQTLDLMSTKNYLMIDIRSEKDKNKAGVPRLPSSAKNKLISIPLEELPSKIRSLVRNVKKVEAELVGVKISYLKRIGKGSNIVILDSYSDSAKMVARALSNLGFKNCWVVTDGFSGSKGWLQSRLGIDSYNLSFAEIVSPSRIIPAASKRFSTSSSSKLLPGGSE
ncbi:calcium sensing receptor, chloroplastic [Olea europaea var. sylvestris]|uniref:calcium sensing receptor, chloroplastic n=1 Tax=Olea europaea var. sylvestris TaxID=158386 RepID=UPI000C1D170B|nr:calcium sensing receptor, chloroplastic [Olea europaea var. sylvestris]